MPENKKISKSQQRAVKKYVNSHYDRIEITAPKGYREKIKAHASAVGESQNEYIRKAIDKRMNEDDLSGHMDGDH